MVYAPANSLTATSDAIPSPRGRRDPTARQIPGGILLDDGLRLNLEERTTTVGQQTVDLTYLEFELLAHLLTHPRQVFTRRRLLEAVWGYPEAGGGRTVDVHVARVRRKLGTRHRDRLVTVRRVGYKYTPHEPTVQTGYVPLPRSGANPEGLTATANPGDTWCRPE